MIAVRPPEYWPRLSYFALMGLADRFVLADTFQYSRQSFQNRTRLRTPQGWQWISVPLRGGQHGRPITDVELDERTRWPRKHWRSLEYNYRSTPFFEYYEDDLAPLFEQPWHRLADLTCATVACLHRLLGLATPLLRAARLSGRPDTTRQIMEAVGAGRLLAPEPAAAHDAQHTPSVCIFRYKTPVYRQNFEGFAPEMSVLDLLFNHGPEAGALLRQGIQVEDFA